MREITCETTRFALKLSEKGRAKCDALLKHQAWKYFNNFEDIEEQLMNRKAKNWHQHTFWFKQIDFIIPVNKNFQLEENSKFIKKIYGNPANKERGLGMKEKDLQKFDHNEHIIIKCFLEPSDVFFGISTSWKNITF